MSELLVGAALVAFGLAGAAFAPTLARWHFRRATESRRQAFVRAYRFTYLAVGASGLFFFWSYSMGVTAFATALVLGVVRVIGAFIVAPDE